MSSTQNAGPHHAVGVALAGFMGAGKSTVGAEVARRLGWVFIDLDRVVEGRSGRTVSALFEELGEPSFRQMEQQCLASVLKGLRKPAVIALGGGALLSSSSLAMLRGSGLKIVVLQVTLATAVERVRGSSRPLISRLEALFRARAEHYASLGPAVEADSDTVDAVANAVMELL